MHCRLSQLAALFILACLLSTVARGQEDETYDFDGVADMDPQPDDPTDWMTSVNWSDGGFDPLPQFGPAIPDFGTRVEIQTSTYGVDAPEIGPGDAAQAFGVRIGRAGGAGLLTMSGGTLDLADSCTMLPFTCNRRIRVGSADVSTPSERQPGTFNLSDGAVTTDTLWIGSGSYGEMNMSGGTVTTRGDLSMDWTYDAGSLFSLTGGTVTVGSDLRMYRNSILDLDGGTLLIDGFAGLGYSDSNVTQTPNATVNIRSGLLETAEFLRVQGSTIVDGGILRANSFEETLSTGTVEINEGGTLQFAQESIADVEGLILGGFITTSSPLGTAGFVIDIVDVNGTDFTQVAFASGGAPGDFNDDGMWDCADIDALTAAVASMSTDLAFDMNGDGSVTRADITDAGDGWLAVGGANNPAATGGRAFLEGDANLDGSVDVPDFNVWNGNKFTANSAWCSGDFTADGSVDVPDFNVWNGNKFTSSATVAVPEPGFSVLWLAGLAGWLSALPRVRHARR